MTNQLSRTEYEIMEYFWRTEESHDFSSLMRYFNEEENRSWKKQTLNTFLSRLISKGMLNRHTEGKKARYSYKVDEIQYRQQEARSFLEKRYNGKVSNFIAALTGQTEINDLDEAELLEFIQDE